tara:strand:+ start:4611 stop:4808 length:198 start_codon:yes stop_codon:yes gene_type:complete
MEDYSDYEMLKGGQSKETVNLNSIREQFLSKYCMSRGWDVKNLTPEQLNEITTNKEYINPGMILG